MHSINRTVFSSAIFLFLSCYPFPEKTKNDSQPQGAARKNEPKDYDFIWQAKKVSKTEITALLENLCDSLSFEVIDFYEDIDSIPETDWLSLDDSLRARGFEVVSSGRGNWEKGPRVVGVEMQSNSCGCRIDKLYYTDSSQTHKYKVTERIACLDK